MNWARSEREIRYLAGIFLVSLALSLPPMNMLLFDALDYLLGMLSVLPTPLFILASFLLLLLVPLLPHLPAFVYGIYTCNGADGVFPWHYLLALFISEPLSFFLMFLRVGAERRFLSPPTLPPWQIEVAFVLIILLVPTYHAYSEYSKYGDFREVVILFMIYAPWVQLVRMLIGYMRLA